MSYGEDDEFKKPVQPDAVGKGGGDAEILASGPLYREVAPYEKRESAGSGHRAQRETPSERGRQSEGPKESARGTGKAKEEPKDKLGKLGDTVREVVPDPIEDLVDMLTPFRSYMVAISRPGTVPTFEVSEPDGEGMVTVTAESQVTDTMAVTVEVTAPVEATPEAPPCVVSVTATDPQTDEVMVPTDTETVVSTGEVPRVAIGEVVEAIVSAAEGDSSLDAGEGRE
ncbi:hypothetical protein [Streptomyces sp. NPDC095613]|uniref:hypothetical protein n=1 Tax=Streptomyces sp. NPDC095613 TaxID=3155540 RepID=UPI00332F12E3